MEKQKTNPDNMLFALSSFLFFFFKVGFAPVCVCECVFLFSFTSQSVLLFASPPQRSSSESHLSLPLSPPVLLTPRFGSKMNSINSLEYRETVSGINNIRICVGCWAVDWWCRCRYNFSDAEPQCSLLWSVGSPALWLNIGSICLPIGRGCL